MCCNVTIGPSSSGDSSLQTQQRGQEYEEEGVLKKENGKM